MKIIVPVTDQNGYQLTIEAEAQPGDTGNLYLKMQEYILNQDWKQTKKSAFGGGFKKEVERYDETVQKVCKTCGEYMKAKEGVSAAGKPYCGWFCPNSREKGCQPIWAQK